MFKKELNLEFQSISENTSMKIKSNCKHSIFVRFGSYASGSISIIEVSMETISCKNRNEFGSNKQELKIYSEMRSERKTRQSFTAGSDSVDARRDPIQPAAVTAPPVSDYARKRQKQQRFPTCTKRIRDREAREKKIQSINRIQRCDERES